MSVSDTRRRGNPRFAIKLALALIVALVMAYVLLVAGFQRLRDQRLERLQALGVPRQWEGVIPAPVPDEKNAAVLYQAAFDRLKLDYRGGDVDCLRGFIKDEPPGDGDALRARTLEILSRNTEALDLVRQAARRPECRFPTNWDEECALLVLMPYLSPLKQCARLLAADAVAAVDRGDVAHAVSDCRAGLTIASHADRDPTIVPYLVGLMIQSTTLSALRATLQRAELPPALSEELFRELGDIDLRGGYREAAAEEAVLLLWCFEAAEHNPEALKEVLLYPAPRMTHPIFTIYLSPAARLIRLREEVANIGFIEKYLALALLLPYREGAYGYQALRDERADAFPWFLITHWSQYEESFSFVRIWDDELPATADRAIAERNAMQVALALEAYHSKHGGYPDALDALQGYPGWKLPDDPFSGKPFAYRRQGQGFILYSWGEDLDDDGGHPIPREGSDGDMVWEFAK